MIVSTQNSCRSARATCAAVCLADLAFVMRVYGCHGRVAKVLLQVLPGVRNCVNRASRLGALLPLH